VVGVREVQEADGDVGEEPERYLGLGEELVGGEPYPGSSAHGFPDIGVSLYSCPVGLYNEHIPRPGEPWCFLCGKWFTSGKAYVLRRRSYVPNPLDIEPHILERDEDSDYHDWPDQLQSFNLEGDELVMKPKVREALDELPTYPGSRNSNGE
jgi:hypothetical protein